MIYSYDYISAYFKRYSVKLDGIITGTGKKTRGKAEEKRRIEQLFSAKYKETLHIDDEAIVCTLGRQYGYNVYQLDAQDDDWKEKIIQQAEIIRKREAESH